MPPPPDIDPGVTAILFKVAGSTYDHVAAGIQFGELVVYRKDSWSELTWSTIGGKLAATDPFEGKAIELWLDTGDGGGSTLRFKGQCERAQLQYSELGWTRSYAAYGLRWVMDLIPHVDAITGTDSSPFNAEPDDPDYLPARAGRSAGQILIDCLNMGANIAAMRALGIGDYNSAGTGATGTAAISGGGVGSITLGSGGSGYIVGGTPTAPRVYLYGGGGTGATATASVSGLGVVTGYTITAAGSGYSSPPQVVVSPLPLTTLGDLAAMGSPFPHSFTFGGEKLGEAIDGAVRALAPNHWFHVRTDGVMRFFDLRALSSTVTLEVGEVDARGRIPDSGTLSYSRAIENCFTRIVCTGRPSTDGVWVGTAPAPGAVTGTNGLEEFFAHSGLTEAQAKALYLPSSYTTPDGSAGQAIVNASIASGAVSALNIQHNGYGYTGTPTIAITPKPGAGAQFTATVSGGVVTGLTLVSGGSGYDSTALPTIAFIGGGGTGASATLTRTGGVVTGFTGLSGGSGYTTAPTCVVSGVGAGSGATATLTQSGGRITAVTLTAGGSAYTAAPVCTIPLPTGGGADAGTCTCPTASTVTITSSDPLKVWAANYWDQSPTGKKGVLYLSHTAGTGLTSKVSARILSHGALTPGGTCTFTIDVVLPNLNFNVYRVSGIAQAGSVVYTRYKVTDPILAAAMAQRFQYPRAIGNSDGSAVTLTSFPCVRVLWSSSGKKPFQESPIGAVFDPIAGTVTTVRPTVTLYGAEPSDVQAFLAINKGTNTATWPADSGGSPVYSGTAYSDRSISRTLKVHIPAWGDLGNSAAVLAYAKELHDSVKDVGHDVSLEIIGQFDNLFDAGKFAIVSGPIVSSVLQWPTGLEAYSLPCLECSLRWSKDGSKYRTAVKFSNRRARYSAEAFMGPPPTGEMSPGFDGDLMVSTAPAFAQPGADSPFASMGFDTGFDL